MFDMNEWGAGDGAVAGGVGRVDASQACWRAFRED